MVELREEEAAAATRAGGGAAAPGTLAAEVSASDARRAAREDVREMERQEEELERRRNAAGVSQLIGVRCPPNPPLPFPSPDVPSSRMGREKVQRPRLAGRDGRCARPHSATPQGTAMKVAYVDLSRTAVLVSMLAGAGQMSVPLFAHSLALCCACASDAAPFPPSHRHRRRRCCPVPGARYPGCHRGGDGLRRGPACHVHHPRSAEQQGAFAGSLVRRRFFHCFAQAFPPLRRFPRRLMQCAVLP